MKFFVVIIHFIHFIQLSLSVQLPSLPDFFDVIGPFPYSYRERTADPLAAFFDWRSLWIDGKFNSSLLLPSELGIDGHVGWSRHASKETMHDDSASVRIDFKFDNSSVNFEEFLPPFGFAGQLWRAMAFGSIDVAEKGRFLLQVVDGDYTQTFTQDRIFIDGELLNGNAVNIEYAWWPINLNVGKHTIAIPISGQDNSETLKIAVRPLTANAVVFKDDIVPDVLDATLAAEWASVVILNAHVSKPMRVVGVSGDWQKIGIEMRLRDASPSVLAGVAATLQLELKQVSPVLKCTESKISIDFSLMLKWDGGAEQEALAHSVEMRCKTWGDAFQFTYVEFDNASIGYAVTRPPAKPCATQSDQNGTCPILFSLHGAGVSANGQAWIDAYKVQPHAYLLLPTGLRPFAFDYQGPSLRSVLTALDSLGKASRRWRKGAFVADTKRLLYAGHSMGGHGCMLLSTHFVDNAIASAPAAGWLSWPYYVPFDLRVNAVWLEPFARATLTAAIAEYDVALYASNAASLPTLVRMGGSDMVVPPWHQRRYARLLDESAVDATFVDVSEVAGEGHWWSGVVDDKTMQEFFDKHLIDESVARLPNLPLALDFTTASPASCGARAGLNILQLSTVGRVGSFHMDASECGENSEDARKCHTWSLRTRNLRRLGIEADSDAARAPHTLFIDNDAFHFNTSASVPVLPAKHFCRLESGERWRVCEGDAWKSKERSASTYGPVRQVYEREFVIVYGTYGSDDQNAQMLRFASWLANNLYLTGRLAAPILADTDAHDSVLGDRNVIVVGGPEHNAVAAHHLPVDATILLANGTLRVGNWEVREPSMGIVFVSALRTSHTKGSGAIMAIIAGTDTAAFARAAAVFPTHTAETVPDWLIVTPRRGGKSPASSSLVASDGFTILGAGFLSNDWDIEYGTSFLLK